MRRYFGLATAVLLTGTMAWSSPVTTLIGDQVNGSLDWSLGGVTPNGSWTGVTASSSAVEFTGTFQHGTPGETMEFSLDITGDDTFTVSLYNNRSSTAGVFPVTAILSDLDWVGQPGRQVTGVTFLSGPTGSSTSFTADSVTVTTGQPAGGIGGYATLTYNYSIQSAVVPEPTSLAILGLLPLLTLRRMRRQQV